MIQYDCSHPVGRIRISQPWSSWRWCQMFRSGGGRPVRLGCWAEFPVSTLWMPETTQNVSRHCSIIDRGGGQKSSQLRTTAMIKHCQQPCISSVWVYIFFSPDEFGPKYTPPPLHPKYPMVSRMVKLWDFRWMIMGPTQNFRSKIKRFLGCFSFIFLGQSPAQSCSI